MTSAHLDGQATATGDNYRALLAVSEATVSYREARHAAEEDEKARHLPAQVVLPGWRLCSPGGTSQGALPVLPPDRRDSSDPQLLFRPGVPRRNQHGRLAGTASALGGSR